VKLPFKIPSFKLPKFGRKKADDDEDEDDDDFDPSDFEGDENASLGEAPISPGAEGGPDEPAAEGNDEGEHSDEEPSDASTGDPEEPRAEAPDLEDIVFGGDDEADDDDDDDDEESGGKSKRKMLVIGGGATAGVLLIGGLSWYFLSGDSKGDVPAAHEETGVPMVILDIAPKKKAIGGNSLNAIAAGTTGPGDGVVASVMSPQVFASMTAPPVDAPLSEGNDPGLSEASPQGPLPIVAKDGRQPWQVYAKPFAVEDARPKVAIVVSGLGMSKAASEAAIRLLPGNVTLAFNPYAPGLLDWVVKARQAGHEVLIMVPLEPTTFPLDDPGPQGLMTTNAPEENRLRLEFILSRMTGYIGVMTVMGSKFNSSEDQLRTLLGELKTRGLMFLEGDIDANSLAPKIATEIALPRALTNIIVDEIPTKAAIDDQLSELENALNQQSAVVAIAEAYPSSIERLAAWTASLDSKNIVLAPLSALADKQFLQ